MRAPVKATWSTAIVGSMRALVFIVATGSLVACSKTEDYLRDMVTKHSDLVDPGSAMFRNITYHSYLWDTWCGEINAKNRMGGYVGWKPFDVTVHKDGKVFVTVLQPKEVPFGATTEVRERIENLNRVLAEIYESDCRNAQSAPSWVPFWKAF